MIIAQAAVQNRRPIGAENDNFADCAHEKAPA
jgi:hypothetical protein